MVRELVREYRGALRQVNRARMKAADLEDRKTLGSCADSLSFAIDYMEKGKHPENRRAITRRSGVQREVPTDPQSYAFIKAVVMQSQPEEVSEKMQKAIADLRVVLKELSIKEHEAYLLVRGSGYSFGEAAKLMNLQKGTVQVLVRRAEEKIYSMVADLGDEGIVFRRPMQVAIF